MEVDILEASLKTVRTRSQEVEKASSLFVRASEMP
jgi:hypothetical protein